MKNIYILKEWFNMKEIKNGVISEEALEEIAGGLSLSKSNLLKAFMAAGVTVLTDIPFAASVVGTSCLIDKKSKS